MKKILLMTCASFTAAQLLFAAFSQASFAPEVNSQTTWQTFCMSLSIALLMVLYENIADRFGGASLWLDALLRLAICYSVVFTQGAYFGMIAFSWRGLWQITPLLVLIFLLTYTISYLTCTEWAAAINQSIRSRRE